MAKFYGPVGFVMQVETERGVWEDKVFARNYAGDILQNHRRVDSTETLSNNTSLNNRISIVADDFALQNIPYIRYVYWNKSPFVVTMADYQYPRIILTLGGLYNGQQAPTTVCT